MKRSPNSARYRCFPSSSKPSPTSEEDVSEVEEERFGFDGGHAEVGAAGGGGGDDAMTDVGIDAEDDEEASLKKMMSRKFVRVNRVRELVREEHQRLRERFHDSESSNQLPYLEALPKFLPMPLSLAIAYQVS